MATTSVTSTSTAAPPDPAPSRIDLGPGTAAVRHRAPESRRTLRAWSGRLRTWPGRLAGAGALLAALIVAFGIVAAVQLNDRARAADRLVSDSGPLSQDAAEIYRSLADADTTAAAGFLLAAQEPPSVRERYEKDLATAAELLSRAAARTGTSSEAQQWIAALNRQLPVYAGLVERARANDRQRLPLGGAYLRYASSFMQDTLLPDAQRLVDSETTRLDRDFDTAEAFPWGAVALGLTVLAALAWCQFTVFRHTNRIVNVGMAGATVAVLAAVLWVVAGVSGAADSLRDSRTQGAEPLRLLNQARFDALQAHTAENLNLVARGSSERYKDQWLAEIGELQGLGAVAGSYEKAAGRAPDSVRAVLDTAVRHLQDWETRHNLAANLEKDGDYEGALRATVSATPDRASADVAFAALEVELAKVAAAEKREFADAARGVDGDLRVPGWGAAAFALLAVVGVGVGINRRLAEYR